MATDILGLVNLKTRVDTLGDDLHSPVANLTALAALSGADLDDGGIYPCNDDGTGDPALYVYDAASTEAASPPDIVLVTAGGRMYVRRGPAGADGSDGADGATVLNGSSAPDAGLGADGDFYIDTSLWQVYGPKATTWGSPTDMQGADGNNGAAGATWYSGAGAPAGGLGALGDYYLATDTGAVYNKTGGSTWTQITTLSGPQGIEGPAGPTGGAIFDVDDAEVVPALAVVTPGGTGPGQQGVGSMACAAGLRSGLFEIEFIGAGDVGAAKFKWRHRGGTWQTAGGAGYLAQADTHLTLDNSTGSGQHVEFVHGGTGDDFAIGDTFSFTPVLECTCDHQAGEITVPLVTPGNDSDQFEINSTEIAAGQKILQDDILGAAPVGGYTQGMPLRISKVVEAGKITFGIVNTSGSSALNGKAVMTFAGLAEAPA